MASIFPKIIPVKLIKKHLVKIVIDGDHRLIKI